MPYTNQDPEPDGDKVAFDDVPRHSSEPELAAFEEELRRRLDAKPSGRRLNKKWKRELDEWIVTHSYVRCRTLRQAFLCCPRDARTAEEVAEETRGRVWQDLNRAERPALGWDGRDSGFWPQVIWRQTMKTLRDNDPYWAQGRTIANSEVVQAVVDNGYCAESADARLLREEHEERQKLWGQVVDRTIRALVRTLTHRARVVADLVVIRDLDTHSIANKLGVKHETVLDHWRRARELLAQKIDLRALARQHDIDLAAELSNEDLIDLLCRKSL